jgi:tryptophan-rich sensory protein
MAGAVALAVLVNGLIFAFDLRGGGTGQRNRAEFPLLPPAWVIGAVWTVLLALMGFVQSQVLRRTRERALVWLVPLLFANCLLYPVYTAGFTNEWRGLLGNLATLALAAYVAGRLHSVTRLGAVLIAVVMAWALFATFASFRWAG